MLLTSKLKFYFRKYAFMLSWRKNQCKQNNLYLSLFVIQNICIAVFLCYSINANLFFTFPIPVKMQLRAAFSTKKICDPCLTLANVAALVSISAPQGKRSPDSRSKPRTIGSLCHYDTQFHIIWQPQAVTPFTFIVGFFIKYWIFVTPTSVLLNKIK